MIERHVRDFLRSVAAIRNRVDKGANFPGIYADNVPQGHSGECIVLGVVSVQHNTILSGEISERESIVQVSCYSDNTARAYSLAELVRNRLSGYRGPLGDSAETEAEITIENSAGSAIDDTADASDKFIHSYTVEYSVFHTTAVPNFT